MSKPRRSKSAAGNAAVITPPAAADIDYELQQEARRNADYQAAKENRWGGLLLKSWSRERESLFIRITDIDEGRSGLDQVPQMIARLAERDESARIEDLVDAHLFIEQAGLVLYLASHEPEQWDHLRGRPAAFVRAANAWAEQGIPLGQEWPSIHQAVALRTQHKSLIAIRRPSGHGGAEGE
jgi:hypothetical protein